MPLVHHETGQKSQALTLFIVDFEFSFFIINHDCVAQSKLIHVQAPKTVYIIHHNRRSTCKISSNMTLPSINNKTLITCYKRNEKHFKSA